MDENVITTKTLKASTTKTASKKPAEKPVEHPAVAVFTPNPLWHSGVGRLEQGYTILSEKDADLWMSISPKVRIASPQEVASAYGV